jgi:hypothetical protein
MVAEGMIRVEWVREKKWLDEQALAQGKSLLTQASKEVPIADLPMFVREYALSLSRTTSGAVYPAFIPAYVSQTSKIDASIVCSAHIVYNASPEVCSLGRYAEILKDTMYAIKCMVIDKEQERRHDAEEYHKQLAGLCDSKIMDGEYRIIPQGIFTRVLSDELGKCGTMYQCAVYKPCGFAQFVSEDARKLELRLIDLTNKTTKQDIEMREQAERKLDEGYRDELRDMLLKFCGKTVVDMRSKGAWVVDQSEECEVEIEIYNWLGLPDVSVEVHPAHNIDMRICRGACVDVQEYEDIVCRLDEATAKLKGWFSDLRVDTSKDVFGFVMSSDEEEDDDLLELPRAPALIRTVYVGEYTAVILCARESTTD